MFAALFSHEEKKVYSPREAAQIALDCKRVGAQMVHIHLYKLGGIKLFMDMVSILEKNNGPLVNISISDVEEVLNWNGRKSNLIKSVVVHGADAVIFGKNSAVL